MALTHLIDTSVIGRLWVETVRAVVDPLTHAGRVGRAGITDLEVGYGSRSGKEWDRDMADLAVFPLVETTADHVQRARQVQRLLASRSQRCRKIPGLLIAAAAEEAGLTLLHYDADFDLITKVTGATASKGSPSTGTSGTGMPVSASSTRDRAGDPGFRRVLSSAP